MGSRGRRTGLGAAACLALAAWAVAGMPLAGMPADGDGSRASSAGLDRSAPPLVIAHRGASAAAPEHTIAAYDLAVEQGADVLECDLQLTADDVLVCVHDTTVDRTTGGATTGRVDAFSLDELRTMDFGSWFGPEFAGARIVTFEEQLRRYRRLDEGVQFYAETKAPAEYGGRMEPRLVELLDRLEMIPEGEADPRRAPVIVQSFDLGSLESVKRLAPVLPTAWLWFAPPPGFADGAVPSTVDVVAPAADVVRADPELVRWAHRAGREVHTWTVDDAREIDELLAVGVDGIFSNRPEVLRERVDLREGVDAAARRSPREAASPSDADGDVPWWGVAVAAIVALAAVGAAARWWQVRRRRT